MRVANSNPPKPAGDDLRRLDAAVGQNILIFGLHSVAQPFKTTFPQHKFQPRFVLVIAIAVLGKYADDALNAVDHAIVRQELVQNFGFVRQRTQPAGDRDAEAALAIAYNRPKAQVIDGCGNCVSVGAGKTDLELARQVVRYVLVKKSKSRLLGVGADVERFVYYQPGKRAGGDIANGVVTRLARGQARVRQQVQGVRDVFQRNEMELHVLPRGEVTLRASKPVGPNPPSRETDGPSQCHPGPWCESCAHPVGAACKCLASTDAAGTGRLSTRHSYIVDSLGEKPQCPHGRWRRTWILQYAYRVAWYSLSTITCFGPNGRTPTPTARRDSYKSAPGL